MSIRTRRLAPAILLVALLAACSSSASPADTALAAKYRDWYDQYQLVQSSFEQNSQTLKYVKTAEACNQMRPIQQAGVLLPSTGDSAADAAWAAAMSALDTGIGTCATGANFRDPAALGAAQDTFAQAESNITVTLQKVGAA